MSFVTADSMFELKKSPYILIFVFLLVILAACEKRPSDEVSTDYVSDNSIVEVSNSATQDTIHEEKVIKPHFNSKNSGELINYMDTCRDSSKYSQGILLRMAEDSPEYTCRLLNSDFSHFIIVDKEAMELALFDKFGREEFRYGIACSKNYGDKAKKGDSRTPEGFFSAEGIYDSTDWLFTDDNGVTSKKKGQFGPRFIRLLIPGTSQIGIHGTCAPWSIGHRTSHGCIRVTNENILELIKHVTIGMPVIISPSDRDQMVNEQEGRFIAQVTINPHRKKINKDRKTEINAVEPIYSPTDSINEVINIEEEPNTNQEIPLESPESPSMEEDN